MKVLLIDTRREVESLSLVMGTLPLLREQSGYLISELTRLALQTQLATLELDAFKHDLRTEGDFGLSDSEYANLLCHVEGLVEKIQREILKWTNQLNELKHFAYYGVVKANILVFDITSERVHDEQSAFCDSRSEETL